MLFYFSRRKFKGQVSSHGGTHYLRIVSLAGDKQNGQFINQDQWASEVVKAADNAGVMVFVHGYNTSNAEFVERLVKVDHAFRVAGFKGVVIGYEWPSNDDFLKYKDDRAAAIDAAPHLIKDGLLLLSEKDPELKISLLGHSMGAFVITEAFARVGTIPINGIFRPIVDKAVFVAADIETNKLRKKRRASRAIHIGCNRLVHYHCNTDRVLDLSGKIINIGTKRSGRHGIVGNKSTRITDIDCTAYYKRRYKSKGQDRLLWSHNWYFDDAWFSRNVVDVLMNKHPPQKQS